MPPWGCADHLESAALLRDCSGDGGHVKDVLFLFSWLFLSAGVRLSWSYLPQSPSSKQGVASDGWPVG
jgi:hypothetical protein